MRKAALALVAVLLAAGCSSSNGSQADDPVVSPPASAAPTSTAPTPSVPPTILPPTVTPPTGDISSPSAPPSSPSPTHARTSPVTAPPIVQRSTCTKLTIRVVPGGASVGQEIAALQFTNDGSAACELIGYPSVTLLRSGKVFGRPSQPASTGTSRRSLAPGETAESLLHDYVGNCQAPLSDQVRVVAPGSTQTLARPFVMRACVLRVDRLGAPD